MADGGWLVVDGLWDFLRSNQLLIGGVKPGSGRATV